MCFPYSKPVPQCLTDISLIPPCDRILLQMTFAELYRWSIQQLRYSIQQVDLVFKSRGVNPCLPSANNHDNAKVSAIVFNRTHYVFSVMMSLLLCLSNSPYKLSLSNNPYKLSLSNNPYKLSLSNNLYKVGITNTSY